MARVEVRSEVAGTVWSLERDAGEAVAAGEAVVILESMKMEVPVEAPVAGRVAELAVAKDDPVEEGQVVAILETAD
ncbi:MAG: acetyl-CoA carboxylase biotin carboxyl carrier protein subunit [Pseudomonadales bacterium]|jgi:biotin carboxyl carrier protein|nr:acetyl-CoA carboxylase biotin carboxyl carrier protein subunit [Pseudomonadales bacterium]